MKNKNSCREETCGFSPWQSFVWLFLAQSKTRSHVEDLLIVKYNGKQNFECHMCGQKQNEQNTGFYDFIFSKLDNKQGKYVLITI